MTGNVLFCLFWLVMTAEYEFCTYTARTTQLYAKLFFQHSWSLNTYKSHYFLCVYIGDSVIWAHFTFTNLIYSKVPLGEEEENKCFCVCSSRCQLWSLFEAWSSGYSLTPSEKKLGQWQSVGGEVCVQIIWDHSADGKRAAIKLSTCMLRTQTQT